MRSCRICFFIILLVCFHHTVNAQQDKKLADSTKTKGSIYFFRSSAFSDLNAKTITSALPQNHYLKTIGFFCTKELQIEKATKLPLRFRLGSVSYTDKLENKNGRPTLK